MPFRYLVFSAVVVLAVGGSQMIGAAKAHAVPVFATSVSPVEVLATGAGVGEVFTVDGVTFECKVSHYTGTAANESSTLTLHPTYTECALKGGSISVTVDTTGCNYVFHATEKVAAGSYKAHVDVGCEAGKEIKITAATCAATVPGQTGLTTVDIRNNASDVSIQPTLAGIKATVTVDGFLCPFNGTGAKTGGTYTSTSGITGTAASGTILVTGE
jgi:hypothetical protein